MSGRIKRLTRWRNFSISGFLCVHKSITIGLDKTGCFFFFFSFSNFALVLFILLLLVTWMLLPVRGFVSLLQRTFFLSFHSWMTQANEKQANKIDTTKVNQLIQCVSWVVQLDEFVDSLLLLLLPFLHLCTWLVTRVKSRQSKEREMQIEGCKDADGEED